MKFLPDFFHYLEIVTKVKTGIKSLLFAFNQVDWKIASNSPPLLSHCAGGFFENFIANRFLDLRVLIGLTKKLVVISESYAKLTISALRYQIIRMRSRFSGCRPGP